MDHGLIGHNVGDLTIAVEVRLFNSLSRFGGREGPRRILSLPAGGTLGDVLDRLRIPQSEVFLALQNGRDVTASLHTGINTERTLDEGDVVALSGPVPYSWGYGSPVV
jgi:hypothetical protein